MKDSEINYLKRTIEKHISIHFEPNALNAYKETNIIWATKKEFNQITNIKPGTIVVLTDNDCGDSFFNSWSVNFRGTNMIFWGKIQMLESQWKIDDENNPIWYQSDNGLYMPSWDLYQIAVDLLTLKEETNSSLRDKHGRFTGKMSPRHQHKLLEVPIFNNSVAALVDLCMKIQSPNDYNQAPFTKPINFCISHDLDQLRGDDFWTQLSRLARFFAPLKKFKFPDFLQLKYFLLNAVYPRKYFMEDLHAMLDLEKKFGYKSSSYILCGNKGRFRARTSFDHIKKYVPEIIGKCNIGMHYNYDTHFNEALFLKQKTDIESIVEYKIITGRSHYLRFNPIKTHSFLSKMGIKFDETVGYSDTVGYRSGIAGPYHPYCQISKKELPIMSLPLIAMDSCITDTYKENSISEIERHIAHLNVVGGTFTLLFHPGRFNNPEYPESRGIYNEILNLLFLYKAKCILPAEVE